MSTEELNKHSSKMHNFDMRSAFREDTARADKLSLEASGFFLDYSKNLINGESIKLLLKLAEDKQVMEKFSSQLAGEIVNPTERQAASHTAMRGQGKEREVKEANEIHQRIYDLDEKVRHGAITGIGGTRFKRIVNLGIGGSYLGGALICDALQAQKDALPLRFIHSLSPTALDLSSKESIASTLVILSSKSFSTEETLTSAEKILDTYSKGDKEARAELLANNFYAVTAFPEKAIQFGIKEEHIFSMAKSIGGRFSLWSAIAMPIIMHIGKEDFKELLQGAAEMDKHALAAKGQENMPLILALLSYWYVNHFGTTSICVNAYESCLANLPNFLQQLVMESCGKQARIGTQVVKELSAKSEVLWGGEGTAIQHSYMQLCHQGNQLIPIDFIVGANPPVGRKADMMERKMQQSLVAHCLAQSQALLMGKSRDEAENEAKVKGMPPEYISHLIMPGNRPSNTIIYDILSPKTLGALIALYEHKTVLFAYLSDINPFDQWGVELGKQLSSKIKSYLADKALSDDEDPSTAQLIKRVKDLSG